MPSNPTPPPQIGRYRIESTIGGGVTAVVYRATDPGLDITVALKVLRPELAQDADAVARFRREAQAAVRLRHRGIVTILDVGEDGPHHFIAMDFLEGRTLEHRLHEGVPLTPRQAMHIASQLADALDYAHSRGTIHRDIKPTNIMIGPDGHATLMDFGLALVLAGGKFTTAGTVLGTPAYMSPEQAKGHLASRSSDIYSLGVVLYEILAGRLPFDAEHPHAVMNMHIQVQPPSPRAINVTIPPSVDDALLRSLAKDPAKRWPSAREMVAALESGYRNYGPTPHANVRQSPPPRGFARLPSMRPRLAESSFVPVIAALAAAVVLTAIAGMVYRGWWMGPPGTGGAREDLTPIGTASSRIEPSAIVIAGATAMPDMPEVAWGDPSGHPTQPPIVSDTPPPEPVRTPTPTRDSVAGSTRPTTSPSPPADRITLTLRSPGNGTVVTGCVPFAWSLQPGVTYDLHVCYGDGCVPNSGIYRGTSTIQWAPAKQLQTRPDLSGRTGIYRWRIVEMLTGGKSSDTWEFEWRGGECGLIEPGSPPTPSDIGNRGPRRLTSEPSSTDSGTEVVARTASSTTATSMRLTPLPKPPPMPSSSISNLRTTPLENGLVRLAWHATENRAFVLEACDGTCRDFQLRPFNATSCVKDSGSATRLCVRSGNQYRIDWCPQDLNYVAWDHKITWRVRYLNTTLGPPSQTNVFTWAGGDCSQTPKSAATPCSDPDKCP